MCYASYAVTVLDAYASAFEHPLMTEAAQLLGV